MSTRNLLLFAVAFLAALLPARGQEGEHVPAQGAGSQGGGFYSMLTNEGVALSGTDIGEALGNPVGGHRQGAVYDGLLILGSVIDLGRMLDWQGVTLAVDGIYPYGSSITRNDVRDFNGVSSIDTVHSPRLYEAWVEKVFDSGVFAIRAGQVPIDSEFFLSTNGSLFVNSAFGVLPSVGMNVNVAVYPVAAPGVRLKWTPDGAWNVLGGVYDGNIGDLHSTDRNGLRFNLNGRDGAFAIGEVDYTVNPAPGPPPDGKAVTERALSGTYKLGVFYDTAHFPDDVTGVGHQGDYGGYFIVDQELWHAPKAPDEGLRGFFRVGLAPPDRNQVEFYCDGGINYVGLIPGRNADLLGIGVSYTKISDDLRDPDGDRYAGNHETIIELTYQAAVTSTITVQPDIQYIFNPGAVITQENALVLGVRASVTF